MSTAPPPVATVLDCRILFPFDLPLEYDRSELAEAFADNGGSPATAPPPEALTGKTPSRFMKGKARITVQWGASPPAAFAWTNAASPHGCEGPPTAGKAGGHPRSRAPAARAVAGPKDPPERLQSAIDGIEELNASLDGSWDVRIFPFGVGLVALRVVVQGKDLAEAARRALSLSRARWDGEEPQARAKSLARQATERLTPHVQHALETCLVREDFYPIYIQELGKGRADAEAYVRKQERVLAGLVAGEPHWKRLSDFTLQSLPMTNFGYYRDEAVLASESGAFLASRYDNEPIYQLLEVAYAQRFALMAWNHLLNVRTEHVHQIFAEARGAGWRSGARLRRLADRLFDMAEDKVNLLRQIRDTTDVPRLQEDWHLARVYAALERVFRHEELERLVSAKLDEMEKAYTSVHDVLQERRTWAIEVLVAVLFILEMVLLTVWYWREFSHV